MQTLSSIPKLLTYQGQEWIKAPLPKKLCKWIEQKPHGWQLADENNQALKDELTILAHHTSWQWPDRLVVFITDLHADPEAFSASLVASGLFIRLGPLPQQIAVIPSAPSFEVILGGDYIDKGSNNLGLLRLIGQLINQDIPITLLSGNHDLRLHLAVKSLVSNDNLLNRHFVIRLGSKIMTMCTELLNEYPLSSEEKADLPSEEACLSRLLLDDQWYFHFRQEARSHLSDLQIETELTQLRSRERRFISAAKKAKLSMQQIYAALKRWAQLFLEPTGEFHWFTKLQQLGCRRGSFIFIHAGCDNHMAIRLATDGIERLNEEYREALNCDPFELYYSLLGNMLRTKYRPQDPPLSSHIRRTLHQAGIHAFVHGHRNLHYGQRITFRSNMLHFECDTTLNKVSRENIGLKAEAAAATLLSPDGWVLGISSDYPAIKHFTPDQLQRLVL